MADAAESVSPEETCPKCLKPRSLCVCDEIVPIDNRVTLLVLQHPQEQDKTLGTGRVVVQSLKQCRLQGRAVLAEFRQGARPTGRPAKVGGRLSRLDQARRFSGGARDRGLRQAGSAGRRPGRGARRDRGHRPSRRDLEPGEDAVVAEPVGAQGEADRAQAEAALPLRQTSPRAAPRGPVDARIGGAGPVPARGAGRRSRRRCSRPSGGCSSATAPHRRRSWHVPRLIHGGRVVKLSFHGADRDVTGSCHLVECAGKRVLVDCGVFQGEPRARRGECRGRSASIRRGSTSSCSPMPISTIADACRCSSSAASAARSSPPRATRELARLVMLDAAHIAGRGRRAIAARRALRRGKEGDVPQPLYTHGRRAARLRSVRARGRLRRSARRRPGHPRHLHRRRPHPRLGPRAPRAQRGRQAAAHAVLRRHRQSRPAAPADPPTPPPAADLVVMEATYGDRLHRPFAASVEEFIGAIAEHVSPRRQRHHSDLRARARAGAALSRSARASSRRRLNPALQVFLDSPMAISATEIFRAASGIA